MEFTLDDTSLEGSDTTPETVSIQVVTASPETIDAIADVTPLVPAVNSRYANIMIPTAEWDNRLQDVGCTKGELKVKRYKGHNIAPYGPKEAPHYYYNLSSIAIDYVKSFKKEKDLGRGWTKVPKNPTDIKTKIVSRLLSIRKLNTDNNRYELDQFTLLDMLQNVWGYAQPSQIIHFNDRLRLFGLIMTIPKNRPLFERLALGVTHKNVLDDVAMQPKKIFQDLTFDFCNELLRVELPKNSVDVDGADTIDPNDITRIKIHRDCMCCVNFILILLLF